MTHTSGISHWDTSMACRARIRPQAYELAALRQASHAAELRGLAAVEREWAARGTAAGRAVTFDWVPGCLREPEVIIGANVAGPGLAPPCPSGMRLVAAIDVEWSKNYRIRGGNVPFCYSVAWLPLPASSPSTSLEAARFWYACVYVENASERADLAASADTALAALMEHASLIAGHQLCSDLAILTAAAGTRTPAVTAAADAWRRRRQDS